LNTTSSPPFTVSAALLFAFTFQAAVSFIVFVPLGALTLLVMLAMPSQRFVEKVIENSEKNTEDSIFEDMVRKY